MATNVATDRTIALSVVVPVLNEAGNIPELAHALVRVLDDLCQREGLPEDAFEIIFVDDGSVYASWKLIEAHFLRPFSRDGCGAAPR